MAKRIVPEVSAGSMADIAFLLLIFFLVTTTIDKDKGLARQIPVEENTVPFHERNVLPILINGNGEILIDYELKKASEITDIALAFIDNGGATSDQKTYCSYCQGKHDTNSSDTPQKAIIAISTQRTTPYGKYITVQNELAKAYAILRNRESQKLYGYRFTDIHKEVQEGRFKGDLKRIKVELKTIKDKYPLLIIDAETKKRGSL